MEKFKSERVLTLGKAKNYTENAESTEFAEKRKRRGIVAFERRRPPFIPKKHRDGAEIAECAKDGAPSSTSLDGVRRQTQDPGTHSVPGAPSRACGAGGGELSTRGRGTEVCVEGY